MDFLGTNFQFKTPSNIIIAGTTMSGKSTLIAEILRHKDLMFDKPLHKVAYCYGVFDESYLTLASQVDSLDLFDGLPEELLSNPGSYFDRSNNNCIILDDLGPKAMSSPMVEKLFTVLMHHYNITCILVLHNIFFQSKYSVTINRNCQYFLLTKTLRDQTSIATFGRQSFPEKPKFLISAYRQAMDSAVYPHLLVDLHPLTPKKLAVRQNILPGQTPFVYIPE